MATVLPQRFADLQIIIVRREAATGFQDFRVRRHRVLDALQWLKQNNEFYQDIPINLRELDRLPSDDTDVTNLLTYVEEGNSGMDDVTEDDDVVETVVINLPYFTTDQQVTNRLAPSSTAQPINEYREEGYIAKCFPHLFPTGKATFNYSKRTQKLEFKEWVNFLMHYPDKRFAQDPRFRFFCLNKDQSHDSATKCSIYADKQHFSGTVEQLSARLELQPSLLNNLLALNSGIRGIPPYWYQSRCELEAMINQLRLPTIFLTLSAADLWWPDIQKLFSVVDSVFEDEKSLARHMQRHLNDNPLMAAVHFEKRVLIFMKEVEKILNLKD